MKSFFLFFIMALTVSLAQADPCFRSDVNVGTICEGGSIYAGSLNQKHYMTTPGNCTDLMNPVGPTVCDGKVDSQKKNWGAENTFTSSVDVENGQANTAQLVEKFVNTEAAKFCHNMTFGGYTDWFLPSEKELLLLLTNANAIGAFLLGEWYWTSTETPWNPQNRYAPLTARAVRFNFGASNLYKSEPNLVRCVRFADPQVLPKPEIPLFKKVREEQMSGQIFYKPEIEKFIVLDTSYARSSQYPLEYKLIVHIANQNFEKLAEVDIGEQIISGVKKAEILTSSSDHDKIVVIIKDPRRHFEGYDITASVLDISKGKLLFQKRISHDSGYSGFYLFKNLLLSRENFEKTSVFKAYTLDGKLQNQLEVKNYNSIYQSSFAYSRNQDVLNIVNCEPNQNSYYDFFTGVKKFEIKGQNLSHTQFRSQEGPGIIFDNENIIYDTRSEDRYGLYLWSQLDGRFIGRVDQTDFRGQVHSGELDRTIYSTSDASWATNEMHVYQTSTGKKLSMLKCRCIPISMMKDPEDGKLKVIAKSKSNELVVIDIESGKIQYEYFSPFGGFNDNSKYLGFGRFSDISLSMHGRDKAYQIVFNTKTGFMEFVARPGFYNFKIRYFNDDLFWTIDDSVTVYHRTR